MYATCAVCGTRLIKGICKVVHCSTYNSRLKQILAEGHLPFNQAVTALGILRKKA